MNIHKALTASAMAIVLGTPGLALATSPWHESKGEGGATFYPDHVKGNQTRAEVRQVLEAARKDGSLWYLQLGLQVPVQKAGPGKSREEVRKEVLNRPAEGRRSFEIVGGP